MYVGPRRGTVAVWPDWSAVAGKRIRPSATRLTDTVTGAFATSIISSTRGSAGRVTTGVVSDVVVLLRRGSAGRTVASLCGRMINIATIATPANTVEATTGLRGNEVLAG